MKSVGYSDLLRLTKDDLWEALVDYPENRKFLLDKGIAKLKKDNLLEDEEEEEGGEEKDSKKKVFGSRAKVEENFQTLEKLLESLEQTNDETLNALKLSCESIKKRIDDVNKFYEQKVGITV